MEEPFIQVSLKEEKVKKLSQVITNDTCRNILNYLSKEGSATETKISEELKIPLSTVHYNLKQLASSGLVKTNEFHYSKKGKEMIHYKLANKYIIIAPKEESNVLEKLKRFLPATIGVIVIAGILKAGNMLSKSGFSESRISESRDLAFAAAPKASSVTSSVSPDIALWFLIGGLFVIIILIIY